MARIRSGTAVAGLTAAALAVIAALAVQASGSAPPPSASGPEKAGPGPAATPRTPQAPAVPDASGSGKRVVYSLSAERVWLLDETEKVLRTYPVSPGTVDPPFGVYSVTSRTARGTGGDGIPIEHVVRFTAVENVVIGFSAAADGSTPTAEPVEKTGGIREKQADAAALWKHAVIGTTIVVVA